MRGIPEILFCWNPEVYVAFRSLIMGLLVGRGMGNWGSGGVNRVFCGDSVRTGRMEWF